MAPNDSNMRMCLGLYLLSRSSARRKSVQVLFSCNRHGAVVSVMRRAYSYSDPIVRRDLS